MLYRLPRDITKPFIIDVNKVDGKKLISWWNANTKFYHIIQKQRFGKLYNVIRENAQNT